MPSIDIRHKHAKPVKEAKIAVTEVAQEISKKFDLTWGWKGNVLHFERSGVNGKIALEKGLVHVTAELGFPCRCRSPRSRRKSRSASCSTSAPPDAPDQRPAWRSATRDYNHPDSDRPISRPRTAMLVIQAASQLPTRRRASRIGLAVAGGGPLGGIYELGALCATGCARGTRCRGTRRLCRREFWRVPRRGGSRTD